jgi:hypothetical protein
MCCADCPVPPYSSSGHPSDDHPSDRRPFPHHPEGALRAQGVHPDLLPALLGDPPTPLDALPALPGIPPAMLGLWDTRRAARYAMRGDRLTFADVRLGSVQALTPPVINRRAMVGTYRGG